MRNEMTINATDTSNESSYDVKAKRKAARARLRAAMQSNPNDRHHGTVAGYKNGCHCARCYNAWRSYKMFGPARKPTAKERVLRFVTSEEWQPQMRQKEIAAACGISKAACSTALKSLQREGKLDDAAQKLIRKSKPTAA